MNYTKKDLYFLDSDTLLELYYYYMSIANEFTIINNDYFNESRIMFISALLNKDLKLCASIIEIYMDMFSD